MEVAPSVQQMITRDGGSLKMVRNIRELTDQLPVGKILSLPEFLQPAAKIHLVAERHGRRYWMPESD